LHLDAFVEAEGLGVVEGGVGGGVGVGGFVAGDGELVGLVEQLHLDVGAVYYAFEVVLDGDVAVVVFDVVVLADEGFFVGVLSEALEEVLLEAGFFLLEVEQWGEGVGEGVGVAG
jgi:hypothetical protein